jgi:hypothetical protein
MSIPNEAQKHKRLFSVKFSPIDSSKLLLYNNGLYKDDKNRKSKKRKWDERALYLKTLTLCNRVKSRSHEVPNF